MNMIAIGKGEELFKKLSGNNTLGDGKILKMSIYEENDFLNVKITIAMRPSSEYKIVLLHFNSIEEYSFSYYKEYGFGVIPNLKFFAVEGKFYLSLDPYGEDEVMLEEDGDVILAGNVVGYSIFLN